MKTYLSIWIAGLAFVCVGLYGWVHNIMALIAMDSVFNGLGVVRIVGIFVAPLGAVLGFV